MRSSSSHPSSPFRLLPTLAVLVSVAGLALACGNRPETRTEITRPPVGEGFDVLVDYGAAGTNPDPVPSAETSLEPTFYERNVLIVPPGVEVPGAEEPTPATWPDGSPRPTSTTTTTAPTTTVTLPPAEPDEVSEAVSRLVAGFYESTGLCVETDSFTGCPSVAVGVVLPPDEDGGTSARLYRLVFGDARIADRPADGATSFELGAQTQLFTAIRLAQLVGPVSLDNRLSTWLPDDVELPEGGESITLRQLATHTSGLPDLPPNLWDTCPVDEEGIHIHCPTARANFTLDMLWEALAVTPLDYDPGSDWAHSEFGYALLGQVLALNFPPVEPTGPTTTGPTTTSTTTTTTTTTSTTVAPTSSLGSLPTTTTTLPPPPEEQPPPWYDSISADVLAAGGFGATQLEGDIEGLATPYYPSLRAAPRWNSTNALAPSGGLVTTVGDMARLVLLALGYESNTTSVALRETLDDRADGLSDPAFEMGLGWQLYPDTAGWGLEHPYAFFSGATAGSTSATAVVEEEGYGVTVLVNAASGADDVALRLLELLQPTEAEDEETTTTAD